MIQSSLDLSWPNSVTKCKRRPKPCQTINCDDMFIVNKGGTVDQLLQAIIAARQHLRSPAVVQAGFKEGPLYPARFGETLGTYQLIAVQGSRFKR